MQPRHMSPTSSHCDFLYASGTAILFALLAVLAWQDVNFCLGCPIGKLAAPICLGIALIVVLIATRQLRCWLCMLAYMIATAVISIYTIDSSFDGQSYHQETIAWLMEGWNPITTSQMPGMSLWCMHYPKALEILEASTSLFFGRIEAGKWINFLLVYSAFSLSFRIFNSIGIKKRIWLWASLATLNPITICQLPTFYIDFAIYCYMIAAIALVVVAINKPTSIYAYAALTAVTVLAIGTKLNAFFYAGLVLILAIAWAAYRKEWLSAIRIACVGAIALVLGGIIFFHPYVTNLQGGHHIFYPLMGEGTVDIMSGNTPALYAWADNRIANFFISIFYPSLPSTDSRWGAFGIGFGILFMISLAMFVNRWKGMPAAARYAGCCLLCSLFVFSQSWWGRYVPQAWLFPILAMAYSRAAYPKLTKAMAALCALCILSCMPRLARSAQYTVRQRIFYSSVTAPLEATEIRPQERIKFNEHGIKYSIVDELSSSTIRVIWLPTIKEVGISADDYKTLIDSTPRWLAIEWTEQ